MNPISQNILSERAPWDDFPAVLRCGNLGDLKKDDRYDAAKAGDWEAAVGMVFDQITAEFVTAVVAMGGRGLREGVVRVMPLLAEEMTGRNKIPLAMADVVVTLANKKLGRQAFFLETGICQATRSWRTNSGADHRLANCPVFAGDVAQGESYLLMDDTLSMGGTIAALRGYIKNRGGIVLGAAVMTAHEGSLNLQVTPKMIEKITAKHGQAMNEFWIEEFGYGIDQLTQGEAGHLRAASSVGSLRDRIAAARNAARQRIHEQLDHGQIEHATSPDAAGRDRSGLKPAPARQR